MSFSYNRNAEDEKPFGFLFERTEEHKRIALNCLDVLKKQLTKEGRIDLVNIIDDSLQQIKKV